MSLKDKQEQSGCAPRVALVIYADGIQWTDIQDSQELSGRVSIRHQNKDGRWTNRTVPDATVGTDREDVLDKLRSLPGMDREGRAAAEAATPADDRNNYARNERQSKREEADPAYPTVRLWSPSQKRWLSVPRRFVTPTPQPDPIKFNPQS
jgi:hypothetical protein